MNPRAFFSSTDIENLSRSGTLVLVSGGPDSVFLFRLFEKLHAQYQINFQVIHFNHHLRGAESDSEAKFVQDLCAQYKIICHVEDLYFDKKTGIPEKARNLRYDLSFKLATKLGFAHIATAHHADDCVETIIMRNKRGAGLKGLAGIRREAQFRNLSYKNKKIFFLRPLVTVFKSELLEKLSEMRQLFCTDSSNLSKKYFRNQIRHDILLRLMLEHKQKILNKSHILQCVDYYFASRVKQKLKRYAWRVPLNEWQSWSPEICFRYFSIQMRRLGFLQQVEQKHFVLTNKTRTKLNLGPAVFLRDEKAVYFTTEDYLKNKNEFSTPLKNSGAYYFGFFDSIIVLRQSCELPDFSEKNISIQKNLCLSINKIKEPLFLTRCSQNELFHSFNKSRATKLSVFFQSHGIPLWQRHFWPVLRDGQNKIIAVVGLEISDEYKLNTLSHINLNIKFHFGTIFAY